MDGWIYEVAKAFRKFLRLLGVADGNDHIGAKQLDQLFCFFRMVRRRRSD